MNGGRPAYVIVPDANGCLVWPGRVDKDGYGYSTGTVHRRAWVRANGPIPAGLEVDHLCRVRNCVNVDHMELVTHAENVRRAWATRPSCKNGHAFTPQNTRLQIHKTKGWRKRVCRACEAASQRAYLQRKRAALAAAA